MTINNSGIGQRHPDGLRIHRPKGSGDYLMLLIKSHAFFTLNGSEIPVLPNTFILYKKGTTQLYRSADTKYCNDWIHFDITEDELRYIELLNIPFDTLIPCADRLAAPMRSLYLEQFSTSPHRNEVLSLHFKLLMLSVSECMTKSTNESLPPHYRRFSALRAEIYNDPAKKRTVESISEELALGQSYFQHLYKALFGVSVTSDIISARVDRAKYLLSGTDYTVTAIAELCGYNSDVHFMRQFKSLCGITPSEYRRRFAAGRTDEKYSK